jgi:hypothetical protein
VQTAQRTGTRIKDRGDLRLWKATDELFAVVVADVIDWSVARPLLSL